MFTNRSADSWMTTERQSFAAFARLHAPQYALLCSLKQMSQLALHYVFFVSRILLGFRWFWKNFVGKVWDTAVSMRTACRNALEALREKTRRKNETHAAKFRLVGNEAMYISGWHKIFLKQGFSSSQQLKVYVAIWGINFRVCVNVHFSVILAFVGAICSVISVARARWRLF